MPIRYTPLGGWSLIDFGTNQESVGAYTTGLETCRAVIVCAALNGTYGSRFAFCHVDKVERLENAWDEVTGWIGLSAPEESRIEVFRQTKNRNDYQLEERIASFFDDNEITSHPFVDNEDEIGIRRSNDDDAIDNTANLPDPGKIHGQDFLFSFIGRDAIDALTASNNPNDFHNLIIDPSHNLNDDLQSRIEKFSQIDEKDGYLNVINNEYFKSTANGSDENNPSGGEPFPDDLNEIPDDQMCSGIEAYQSGPEE